MLKLLLTSLYCTIASLFPLRFSSVLKQWHGSSKIQCVFRKQVSFHFIQLFVTNTAHAVFTSDCTLLMNFVLSFVLWMNVLTSLPFNSLSPFIIFCYHCYLCYLIGPLYPPCCSMTIFPISFCFQKLCLQATMRTTHQECISPCQCFCLSSGLCSKPAWCLMSSQSSVSVWPTR